MFEKEKEKIKNAMRVIDTANAVNNAVNEKLKNGDINTEELAEIIRNEMRMTFDVYREEMDKNFEAQKLKMRHNALWQWLIFVIVVATAIVKDIFL